MGVSKIVQVVGYQNSGKTTLVSHIVRLLTSDGFKVATIKHHGHGSALHIQDRGKDTYKHRMAGAVATCVEGNGMVHFTAESLNLQLKDLLKLYEVLDFDYTIVEGYKQEEFPKIVLIRNQEDEELVEKLTNIIGIITWHPVNFTKPNIPIYYVGDEKQYLKEIKSLLVSI